MAIIHISDEMCKECNTVFNQSVESPGIHEYSTSLFSSNGVVLRLVGGMECVKTIVVDEAAKAEQNKKTELREKRLNIAAAAVGLTVPQYLEKQRETIKSQRIKDAAARMNISEELAAAQIELEDANELRRLKSEFYVDRHPDYEMITEEGLSYVPDDLLAGIDPEDFKNWRYVREKELNKEPDPTKEIVVIKSVTPLHIVYAFDESITGIAGFDTIAKDTITDENTIPSADTLKALLREYVSTEEFKKGLNFIARIADTTLNVVIR